MDFFTLNHAKKQFSSSASDAVGDWLESLPYLLEIVGREELLSFLFVSLLSLFDAPFQVSWCKVLCFQPCSKL